MTLLDPTTWRARSSSTAGRPAAAATRPSSSRRPATSSARVGRAAPADVARAAARAAEAQRDWAEQPYQARAAVLRTAGDLWHAHATRSRTGSSARPARSRPWPASRLTFAAEDCYEAAGLPRCRTASSCPRAAPAEHGPAGAGRRRRRHLAVQLPAHPVDPGRRPGAGAGQRRRPQARPADGGLPAAWPWPASSRRRACRPACCSVLPGGADVGEALVTDPHVRVISFTGSTRGRPDRRRARRRSTSSGSTSSSAATRRFVLDDVDVEQAVSAGAFGRSSTRARSA